ncbi:MAG: hypothetical protein QNL14_18010 [Deltaproteobacteria bacterium]|nr:hypothetical protein [Deltaproteobacteria bacterium]
MSSHYPSDVAAGMAIGIMGAWFFISRTQRRAHYTVNGQILHWVGMTRRMTGLL